MEKRRIGEQEDRHQRVNGANEHSRAQPMENGKDSRLRCIAQRRLGRFVHVFRTARARKQKVEHATCFSISHVSLQ